MRRKRNILIFSLLAGVFVCHYLQLNLVNIFLSAGANVPNLLLILTAFVGVRLGPIAGSFFGFGAGLLQDITIDFIGLHALSHTVVGFTAQYFRTEKVMLIEKYYFPAVVFGAGIIHATIYYFVVSLDGETAYGSLWFHFGFWNALYSSLLAFVWWLITPTTWLEFVRPVRVYA